MKKVACLITAGYLLISFSAVAADLYLLKINSLMELETAKVNISYARGTLDGKFLVELTSEKAEILKEDGFNLELLAADIDPAKMAIISLPRPRLVKTALIPDIRYAAEDADLVKLDPGDMDIYRREGFLVITLDNLQTPLFYNPPLLGYRQPDPVPADTLADLIIQANLYDYDIRLEAFRTRYVYSDSIHAARDWLVSKFQSFGYTEVEYDLFYFGGYPCHNVICVKPGTTEADKIIVVGGHYDSYNSQSDPTVFAPGADDNGSGTAAVLELARAMKDVQTKKTIMFVAFSAEEVGLVGSQVLASNLYYQGADIEFMLNFDMVAYTEDALDDVTLFSGPFRGYADVISDAYDRVSTLLPYYGGSATASDHASFINYGFHAVYVQEGDFNYPGWHTNIDISSRLDFPYFEQLVRGSAAALGYIDNAARATSIDKVYDIGDGQALRVHWNDYDPTYTYKVMVGISSGNYSDTIDVPAGQDYFDVTGLNAGTLYYLAVVGINSEGYGPIHIAERSERPLVVPRAPSGIAAEPDSARVLLSWNKNIELDLNRYQIYRRPAGSTDFELLDGNYMDTLFYDLTALPQVINEYKIMAVDNDENQSPMSSSVYASAATFDGGILLVDEFDVTGSPSQGQLNQFYGSIFDTAYAVQKLSAYEDTAYLSRSVAGQYNTIFWIDDDWNYHLLDASLDSLKWFLNYHTNFFLAGYESIYWLTGVQYQVPGDFVYDYLGVRRVTVNNLVDFQGAEGRNGWPDLHVNPAAGLGPRLPTIGVLDTVPGAKTIYTYDSYANNPAYEGKPAGVAFNNGTTRGIALTFPLYYLDTADVRLMITKALNYFQGITGLPGDIDNDARITVLDIIYLIDYLFREGPEPDLNQADVNQDCEVNILDPIYLIDFKFKGGPGPLPGCVY